MIFYLVNIINYLGPTEYYNRLILICNEEFIINQMDGVHYFEISFNILFVL